MTNLRGKGLQVTVHQGKQGRICGRDLGQTLEVEAMEGCLFPRPSSAWFLIQPRATSRRELVPSTSVID